MNLSSKMEKIVQGINNAPLRHVIYQSITNHTYKFSISVSFHITIYKFTLDWLFPLNVHRYLISVASVLCGKVSSNSPIIVRLTGCNGKSYTQTRLAVISGFLIAT